MFITSKMLREAGACLGPLHHFETLFPDGVACTENRCVALATEFDWRWAACNLLPLDASTKFRDGTSAAYAQAQRVLASAEAEYRRAGRDAWAAAWAKYQRVAASAYDEYIRTQATTFGRLAEAIE